MVAETSGKEELMHAIVVRVTVRDVEPAQKALQEQVVPRAQQSPGFVAGYWTRSENQGLSMVVFDSEENARQAAGAVQANMPPGDIVTLDGVDVREVVANA
jgi:alpha-acetolactate decarboxylase